MTDSSRRRRDCARRSPRLSKLLQLTLGAIAAVVISIVPFVPARGLLAPTVAPAIAQSVASEALAKIAAGREQYRNGQYADAAAMWEAAISSLEVDGDLVNLAGTWTYLAFARQQLGELQAAIESTDVALQVAETLDSPVKSAAIARAANARGSIFLNQGQPEAALTAWQQAAAAYDAAGDEAGRIGSVINQSQALQALGFYRQARLTLSGLDAELERLPNPSLRSLGLLNLGNVLRLSGDLDAARRVMTRSLALTESEASLDGRADARSRILSSLGNVERASRKPEEALSYYQQAIKIAPTPLARVDAQLARLDLAAALPNDPDLAVLWRKTRQNLDALPRSRDSANARIHWMNVTLQLRAAGRIDIPHSEIANVGAAALEIARDLRDSRSESHALGTLGMVYERAGQLDDALRLTEQALVLAQSTNAADIAYRWQWQLGRMFKQRDRFDDALDAYAVAYQTLQSLRRDLVSVNPDVQFTFRDRVEPVYREYVDLLLRDRPEAPPGQFEFQRAREAIEALQLAELDNFFRSACLDSQVVPLDAVDRTGTAVLYPIVLSDRIEVILSLPDEPLQHFASSVPKAEVEQTLLQLRSELAKPYTSPEGKQGAERIYTWLIRPTLPALERSHIDTLAFVLDGRLRDVPMAALYDGDRYLIERYAVAVAPGLQLVSPRSLEPQQLQALTAGLTQSRHGFSPLVHVSSELDSIGSAIVSQTLVDESFTSEALAQQIAELPFPIVHLATHGQFSSNADDTFVLAWDKPIQVEDFDTLLRRRDTPDANASEAIELLVLSACDTAAGDERATLGLAGLALRAGARSTLASLWALDDESGAQLMGKFYRELAQRGTSKAQALRRAQLTMLADPDYRHPAHWSPFVLVGNWL